MAKKLTQKTKKLAQKNILVIGAGTWGTAIANVLAGNNHNVLLSSIESDVVTEINDKHRSSKYLPNIILESNLKSAINYDDFAKDCDFIFIVVPSLVANEVFIDLSKKDFIPYKCSFVICSKGLNPDSLELLTDSFVKINKNRKYAILSGPNFAVEVAAKMPTITNICCEEVNLANDIISILNNDYFRAIYDSQPIAAEICGIIKNILAIGCGVIDGLELGVNAKAAIITYGAQEIKELCKFFGCDARISTAAGFGDIFLTCSSNKSRNNSLGIKLALGEKYQDIIKQNNITYEGAISAVSVIKLCQKNNINLPLCQAIHDIIYKNYSTEQIKQKIITTLIK